MSDLFRKSLQEEIAEGSYDRPIGVSIIAVLLALSGGISLFTQLTAFSSLNQISGLIGVSNAFFQAAMGFLGLSGLAAAVGMWFGKKWGWWLAMFYFAYAVSRTVNGMISIHTISVELGGSVQGQTANYVKYGFRTAWYSFLLYYLCRENASWYFGTRDMNKWKAVLIVFAVCAGIFLIGTLAANI